MKRITALIVCLSIAYGNIVLGQNRYIDSLRMCLNTAKSDSDLLEVLDIIAGKSGNTDTVELYSNIEINLAQRAGNTKMECQGMGHLCWAYNAKGDFGKSCETAYRGLLIAQKSGDKVAEAIFNFHLARSYEVSDPGLSKRHLRQALKTFERENELKWNVVTLVYMAQNEYENRHFDDGDKHIARAIEIANGDDLRVELERAYCTKGISYLLRYKAAKENKGKADRNLLSIAKTWLRKSAATEDLWNRDRALVTIAQVMMTEHNDFDKRGGQIDSCEYALGRVTAHRQIDGNQKMNIDIYQIKTMIYIAKGEFSKAEAFLDSLKKANTDNMRMTSKLSKAIDLMYSEIFSASEQWEKAYRHLQEYNNKEYFDREMYDMISVQENARDSYEEESEGKEETAEEDRMAGALLIIVLSIAAGVVITLTVISLRSKKR